MDLKEAESVEHSGVTKDSTTKNNYNVVIVGGGPSGIATALTLNALGVSNCVIEASTTPRRKFGEAIPPNAKPLLRQLDILRLVEDNHHKKYFGNQSCWGSNKIEQKEFISEMHGHGYLLDRLHFEKQLWNIYQSGNGTLLTGSKLRKLRITESGFQLSVHEGNHSKEIGCQFIVDATGRKATVCRQLGVSKIDLDTQYALSFSTLLEKSIQSQILVESTQNGWWYVAPSGDKEAVVMFFTLKGILPPKENRREFLINELKTSLHISNVILESNLAEIDYKVIPAGTSRLITPYGKNWVAVGDAAFSYDPISSYGITSALASGYYAGQAIASKIGGKEEAMDAYRFILENAFQAYSEKLVNHYNLEQRFRGSHYWEKRLSD